MKVLLGYNRKIVIQWKGGARGMNFWWGRIKTWQMGKFFLVYVGRGERSKFLSSGGTPPFWLLAHCALILRVMGSKPVHSWSHINHLQSCCNHLSGHTQYGQNTAPFCKNYAKLCFDAKHLRRWNGGGGIFGALSDQYRPCLWLH